MGITILRERLEAMIPKETVHKIVKSAQESMTVMNYGGDHFSYKHGMDAFIEGVRVEMIKHMSISEVRALDQLVVPALKDYYLHEKEESRKSVVYT